MNKALTQREMMPHISWKEIDTVLLDMDGTLLDKYFDDYFWEEYVPEVFARHNNLSKNEAEKALLARYRKVESTLQWTDLDYWTEQLGLDIPQLKADINHLIQIHPHVTSFLEFLRTEDKNIHLVTNAHPKTLAIKLEKSNISGYFNSIICAEEVGEAKEHLQFWHLLENYLDFDSKRTLFADDTVKVLRTARHYGIRYLIHVARPSSRLPESFSDEFVSIADFSELIKR